MRKNPTEKSEKSKLNPFIIYSSVSCNRFNCMCGMPPTPPPPLPLPSFLRLFALLFNFLCVSFAKKFIMRFYTPIRKIKFKNFCVGGAAFCLSLFVDFCFCRYHAKHAMPVCVARRQVHCGNRIGPIWLLFSALITVNSTSKREQKERTSSSIAAWKFPLFHSLFVPHINCAFIWF